MRLLANPNTAEVKLIPSLNAMKSVGIKHRSNWRVPKKHLYGKRKQFRTTMMPFSQKLIQCTAFLYRKLGDLD